MASIQPAMITLKYALPGNGAEVYIDIAEALSKINRRGYRQGKQYVVSGTTIKMDTVAAPGNSLQVTLKTAGNTWVVQNAWKKAKSAWMKQQRDVRKLSGIGSAAKPKYEDFKVYLDNGHRAGTAAPVLDGAGVAVQAGEWDYSKFVYANDADPEVIVEPSVHLIGPDVSTSDVGLVEGYADSRASVSGAQPQVPGDADTSIYAKIMSGADDGMSKEIIANMEDDNDSPPYEIYNYAGGAANAAVNWDTCYAHATTYSPVTSTPGFLAQCGLLRVYSQGKQGADGSNTTIPGVLMIHLMPGKYKGVAAHNMGQ